MANQSTITIYTDGASRGNPGPGGWGAVLIHEASGAIKHLAGAVPDASNNKMELLAAIQALKALRRPGQTVVIFSDSRYLIDAFQKGWITTWIEKGWRNSKNKPVKNTGLWKELLILTKQHSVTFKWVAGHNGHTHNEAADRLATGAADYLARTGEVGQWTRRIS